MFACSSCDRGFFFLHVLLSGDSEPPVSGCMCERCVWSAMDWQPAWDEFLSVSEMGMNKQRITDYLILPVAGKEMFRIIPEIPPTATSLYKHGPILLLRRPTVISKVNINVPMGSGTGLVILQILISSDIVWGLLCSPYHCFQIPQHRIFVFFFRSHSKQQFQVLVPGPVGG